MSLTPCACLNVKVSLKSGHIRAGRRAITHRPFPNEGGFDDSYDSFYPQSSSQWDALCHVKHPQYGRRSLDIALPYPSPAPNSLT